MENQKDRAAAKRLSARRARTYAEQVVLIKNKGFIVDDESECVAFLNQASYHRLSEYFLPFRNPSGTYPPNIPFRRIQRIYEFDEKLSVVLLECIGKIERYLRTQFAYFSGHKHGAFGYLDESTFSDKHNHERFLEQIDVCIEKNKRTLRQQHEEKHDENFPIWDLIEFFSLGMLSYFYGDLKIKDQKALAKEMYGAGTLPMRLVSWLRCLTNLRNRCAHYSRLYNWSFSAPPKMPQNIIFTADREKLFAQLMGLKFLYPDKQRWNTNAIAKIETLLTEYREDICLEHIGFPDNWNEILQHTERS